LYTTHGTNRGREVGGVGSVFPAVLPLAARRFGVVLLFLHRPIREGARRVHFRLCRIEDSAHIERRARVVAQRHSGILPGHCRLKLPLLPADIAQAGPIRFVPMRVGLFT
jgi:hypothetical protein